MKLSEKRRARIYEAVHAPIMDARIAVAKLLQSHPNAERIDEILFRAQSNAASWAVLAAEGEQMRRNK